MLLERGADGSTSLQFAVLECDEEVTSVLLDHGAVLDASPDVNGENR